MGHWALGIGHLSSVVSPLLPTPCPLALLSPLASNVWYHALLRGIGLWLCL
ncbi:hypothetical protein FDUTEX481_00122 [Tolypothrix sp. PCC 7601]|nr:hypothetical protein FDUTEX481_00122 [Tolypothrix sp. PCC 7601]